MNESGYSASAETTNRRLPSGGSSTPQMAAGRVILVKVNFNFDGDYKAIVKLVQDEWREQHNGNPPMPIFVLPRGCEFSGVIS